MVGRGCPLIFGIWRCCFLGGDMKEILLTQGKVAIVDDEDFEYLNQWKWQYMSGYARKGRWNNGVKKFFLMHRFILGLTCSYKEKEVDHINGNGLDNRRCNLRVATKSQNRCNSSKPRNNTSGYKGIGWRAERKKWCVRIGINKMSIFLGHFNYLVDAIFIYNQAAIKYHKKFAKLNTI